MVSLEILDCRMGTLEALYRRMAGGKMPAGSECNTDWELAASCHRSFDLGVRVKKDFDNCDAGQGLRFHVLDVIDRCSKAALASDRDDFGHFFGRHSGITPDDVRHRNVDFRKDVAGHAKDSQHAQYHNYQRHYHKGVGTLEGQPDYPHEVLIFKEYSNDK